jgi:hypothetical protein
MKRSDKKNFAMKRSDKKNEEALQNTAADLKGCNS